MNSITELSKTFNGWKPDKNGLDYNETEPVCDMKISKHGGRFYRIVNKNRSHTSLTRFLSLNNKYTEMFFMKPSVSKNNNGFISLSYEIDKDDIIITMNKENYGLFLNMLKDLRKIKNGENIFRK